MITETLSEKHATWLDSRGLHCEIAAEYGLYSRGADLVTPYHTPTGEPLFLKIRGPQKKFWIDWGTTPKAERVLQLWLLHRWRESSCEALIITEGEPDALSFLVSGAECVVSVPNGAALSRPGETDVIPSKDTTFSYLWNGNRLHPELDKFKTFILATDGDLKGQILRDELAIRLGRDRCWWVQYPTGCKDANEVLQKHGRQAVMDLLAYARPIVPNQLVRFSDIPRASGVSLSSGWGDMDPYLRFLLPEVMVISGPPNHGKSQWSLALVANLARVHDMPGAILQFEDDVDRHRDDLIRYARAWRHGQGKPVREEPEAWVDRMFVTTAPPEAVAESATQTLEWIQERIHEAATRHGCKWVLIDPWNEIEHAWGTNETETAYTGKALRELRILARRYQIALIIVTHPSKSGGMKSGTDEMTPYDIAGSAHWANKPDHVVLIHRDREADETVVNVAKSRNFRARGTPAAVRMRFLPDQATFSYVRKEMGT